MFKALYNWFLFAVILTGICGLIYVAVQQDYRQGANDPQIEIAEDVAAALTTGADPSAIAGQSQVDMAKSLVPYVIVFDNDGKVVATNALVNGEPVTFPKGALDAAKEHGQNRVTWQPAKGVRQAAVVVPYQSPTASGFVLAGRSLREVEKRVELLSHMVALGFATMQFLNAMIWLFPIWRLQVLKKKSKAKAA